MTKKTIEQAYEELRQIIDGGSESFTHDDAVQYLKDRLEQPEQEPVAWGFQNSAITGSNRWMMLREEIPANDQYGGALWTPLYTTPPQQELVCVCGAVWEGQELVSTPPQRKPLTDDETHPGWLVWKNSPLLSFESAFEAGVRFAEAAHGIKEKNT